MIVLITGASHTGKTALTPMSEDEALSQSENLTGVFLKENQDKIVLAYLRDFYIIKTNTKNTWKRRST